MQSFVITLLNCSVTMSALALCYMALAPILAKRYSEGGRYRAWLIVVIGLIVPFRPQWGGAFVRVDVPGVAATPVIQIGNGAPVAIPMGNPALPAGVLPDISWWQIVMAAWLAGAIVFLAYQVMRHRRFVKTAGRWSEGVTDERTLALFQSLKTEMGISKQIELYLCSCIGSPMMIGFASPRILLPKTDLAFDELRFILKHELVHYQRKDLLYKYLVLAATAIHWFNPIVHQMAKAIGLLCETSCDAEVMRNMDADARQHYCETIIGLVKYRSKLRTALSTNFYGGKKGMKNRIASIMDAGKKKAGFALVCGALIVTVGTGFAFAASVTASTSANSSANDQGIQSGSTPVFSQEQAEIGQERKQELAEQVVVYEQYGLSYDQTTDTFYYDGQEVRFFADELDDEGTYFTFIRANGTVDLRATRSANHELLGITYVSQEEYGRRTESIGAAAHGTSEATSENPALSGAQSTTESIAENGNAGATTYVVSPGYVDESLKDYVEFGVSYDKSRRTWIFNNKPVNFLIDSGHSLYVNYPGDNHDSDFSEKIRQSKGAYLRVVRASNGAIGEIEEMTVDEAVIAINAIFD